MVVPSPPVGTSLISGNLVPPPLDAAADPGKYLRLFNSPGEGQLVSGGLRWYTGY